MLVLVLNSGSSTLKFQLIDTSLEQIENDADERICKGVVERIGGQALLHFTAPRGESRLDAAPVRDHREAIEKVVAWLRQQEHESFSSLSNLAAVGHRVVHGGEKFRESVLIDEAVQADIEQCVALAPLHNPANLKGISAIRETLGKNTPQVAVFDTAFHSAMPEAAYLYGIPYSLYRRHRIRRYGFHGTSHRYVAYRYRMLTRRAKEDVTIISLHLGNGCSACAIQGGRSVDTSMGMTPLEGLLMGTRCGDLDPSVVEFLIQSEGLSPPEIDGLLNRQSGLLGLSGLTADMRDLLAERKENQDRRAGLAIDVFCHRVKKYVGAYLAVLEEPQALVFTGGIGQNAPEIRGQICSSLGGLGLRLDPKANEKAQGDVPCCISEPSSPLKIWMIPTDEELLIARDTVRCLKT